MAKQPSANLLDLFQLAVILGRWYQQDRDAILGIVELAGLMHRIEALGRRYEQAEPAAKRRARLSALAGEQKLVDLGHDELLRALWYLLTARACYLRGLQPPQPERAAAVLALRDRLLPDGLDGTQQSYLTEESNATQALRELKPADEPLLTEVSLAPGVTGLELLHLLAERAGQLGDLDRAKAAAAAPTDDPENLSGLRNDMVKLIGLVIELARTTEGSRELAERVTGQYDQALARLGRTTRTHETTRSPEPPADPTTPADGSPHQPE